MEAVLEFMNKQRSGVRPFRTFDSEHLLFRTEVFGRKAGRFFQRIPRLDIHNDGLPSASMDATRAWDIAFFVAPYLGDALMTNTIAHEGRREL